MQVETFADIQPEFEERAHRMVWCDMATVGLDGRPKTRIVHPVWDGDTAWVTSMRVGPKAEEIDRNPYVSLAYVADPMRPAYAECVAAWEDDRATRVRVWEWIASFPEPLGYDAQTMFGGYDVPNLTLLKLTAWSIRLTVAGDLSARRVWSAEYRQSARS